VANLCQICTNRTCSSHTDNVVECEAFNPPYRDIQCDICHTPTSPFCLHRVKRGERMLLVCPECVGDAVNHWIDAIEEAAQEATLESAGGEKDVPAGW